MRLLSLRRRRHQVRLYGKPGCHLCEDARALLESLNRDGRLEIEEIDITGDPALFRRYDIRIPVLVIDGGPEMEPPLQPKQIQRLLR